MGPSADVIQFSRDEGAAAGNTVSIYTHSAINSSSCNVIVTECDALLSTLLPVFSKVKIGISGF